MTKPSVRQVVVGKVPPELLIAVSHVSPDVSDDCYLEVAAWEGGHIVGRVHKPGPTRWTEYAFFDGANAQAALKQLQSDILRASSRGELGLPPPLDSSYWVIEVSDGDSYRQISVSEDSFSSSKPIRKMMATLGTVMTAENRALSVEVTSDIEGYLVRTRS